MGAPPDAISPAADGAPSVQGPPVAGKAPADQTPPADDAQPRRKVHLHNDEAATLAKRIYAAKPTTWRGRGDLLQCPWVIVPKGSFLLIDLWSGMGGLPLALLCTGATIYTVAAESDPVARHVSSHTMPNMIHVSDVNQVKARDFAEFLARRSVRAIIIGGGSPCQGNTSLNKQRQGLDDVRSQQPLELCRIRDEFQDLVAGTDIQVITFLENVASMPRTVQDQYSAWLGHQPVLIQAISCGWTHRNRLFWLGCGHSGVSPAHTPPQDWRWKQEGESAVPCLHYCGKKPIPSHIRWESGFGPLFNPMDVLQGQTQLGFHPFTREFYHPADRIGQSSAQAVARFFEDKCRYPPSAYEEHSLVWRGQSWRTLTPGERCQAMGIPPSAVSAVEGPQPKRHQAQNSLIGNGFHLPSVLAMLCFLPQLLTAKIPPPVLDLDELGLRHRLQGSIWEPGRLEAFPDLIQESHLVAGLQDIFSGLELQPAVWMDVEHRLSHCRLWRLQSYAAWCRMQGRVWQTLGPVPITGKDRTAIFAGLSGQRYAASSSRGLDHLLPPGLGPEGHLAASSDLPSPFLPRPWPEPDVTFLVHTLVIWRQFMVPLAVELRHILSTVARAVQPLEKALDGHRCPSSKRVAASKRPGFIAVLSLLLRWPDLQQPLDLVTGYPIVGEFAPTGIFRPIQADPAVPLHDWLGPSAEAAIEKILHSPPPRHAPEILRITEEEQTKGFCGPFMTKPEVDAAHGIGCWRPMERFLIQQSDGKTRAIDNCRRTGHNAATVLHETITTVNVDAIATFSRMVCDSLNLHSPPRETHPWLDLRIGTDDLPDAYRGLPVALDQMCFSYVAVFLPHLGWRFTPMYGLAYGLESAVISFNRFPQLGVAIARRCCMSFCAAYFDDELAVEFLQTSDVSQLGLRLAFTLMGAMPQASKAFRPATNRHYLGTSIHVGDFSIEGTIRFQPKSSTRAKVRNHLTAALESGTMDRDTAGKLRGDLNWMFSNCAGQIGRFAGPVLTALQSAPVPDLSQVDTHVTHPAVHRRPSSASRHLRLRPTSTYSTGVF